MTIYPTFKSGQEELYFAKELEYWGIPNTHFEEKRLVARFPEELVKALTSEPQAKAEPLARWRELGPISFMELLRKSSNDNPVVFDRLVGKSEKSFSFDMVGQLLVNKKNNTQQITGLGRANYRNIIYEGQLVNDSWDGYGRAIYGDGKYHIGYWKNDRKNGYGKSVRKDKSTGEDLVEEGYWENDKLINNDEVKKVSDLDNDEESSENELRKIRMSSEQPPNE